MKPRFLLPLALFFAVTTLSACNLKLDDLKSRLGFNQTEEQPTQQELDACQLLTKEEAAAAVGFELLEPKRSTTGLGSVAITSCTYTASSTTATATSSVRFILQQFASPEEAERNYAAAREQSATLANAKPENVPNLGAAAYWTGGSLNHLGVYTDKRWYQIQMNEIEEPKNKAIELIKAALPSE